MPKRTNLSVTAELKAGKAFIRIVDTISDSGTASSLEIRSQVDGFIAAGIRAADVYLNCRGGNCFEAVEIVNELERLGDVKISVGALAASAGTYLTSSFYTVAKPNSQFMFHRPNLRTFGNIDTITADLKLLQQTTADYYARYARKTGKTEAEIETMLASGDVWLTAAEALKEGFIDAVEGQESPASENEDQPGKVSALASSVPPADREIWSLEDFLENDLKAYEAMQTADPARAKRLEAAYFGSPVQARRAQEPAANRDQTGRESWSLEDYLEKDPKAYEAMRTADPELAKRLEATYFNS